MSRIVRALSVALIVVIVNSWSSLPAQFGGPSRPSGPSGPTPGGGGYRPGPSSPSGGTPGRPGTNFGRGGDRSPMQPTVPNSGRMNHGGSLSPQGPQVPGVGPRGTTTHSPFAPQSSPMAGPAFQNPFSTRPPTPSTFEPSRAARIHVPSSTPITGGWQQTHDLARGGNIDALRQSIDRNLQSDRSLNGAMSAVWSLEQAQGPPDVLKQYRTQAVQLARQQMRQGVNEPLPWVATAKFALEDRDDAAFRQATRELQQRFPTNPQGHYFEGLRAIQDQDWKGAEGSLKKAQELGMSDESLAEMLKLAIDNQKWIWQYAQVLFGVIVGWLCGLVALWVTGRWLSRATLRAIARDQVEAISARERFVRRLYRVVVNVAGIYYFVSLPVVVVTAIALPLALGYATLMVPMLNLWLLAVILIGGFGGVLTAISGLRTAFVKVNDEPIGRSLRPEEAPRFWEFVREIAERMETRPVDDIWLTPHTDLAVTERGSWRQKLRDRGERVLILGAGVLSGFPTDALRCVLAHEYAHFQHRDTAGGDVALRVMLAMDRFAEAIVSRGKIRWWDVTVHFLRWFHFLFRRLTLGASRLQEVLADRAAVRQYGASALESGLRHVIRRSVEFDMLLSDAVRQSVRAQVVPLSFYSANRRLKLEDREELETVVREVLNRRTADDDSHPGPQERFELAKRVGVDRPVGANTVPELFGTTATRLTLDMACLLDELVKARAEEIKAFDDFVLNILTDRLRRNPDAALLEDRAAIHFRLGHFDEAIADLSEIINAFPDAIRPLLSRSVVHEVAENHAAAAADLRRLQSLGHQLPFDVRFEVNYRLGKCLSELRRHGDAVEAFDEAVRMRPDSFLATVGRLQIARELDEWTKPEIVELRQRAITTWPDRAELINHSHSGEPEGVSPRTGTAAQSHVRELTLSGSPSEPDEELPVLEFATDDILELGEPDPPQRPSASRQRSPRDAAPNSGSGLFQWAGWGVALAVIVFFAVNHFRTRQPVTSTTPTAAINIPKAGSSESTSGSGSEASNSLSVSETKQPVPKPFEEFGARLGEPLEPKQLTDQMTKQLSRLTSGFYQVHRATGTYSPFPVDAPTSGLSWRVHMLPYFGLKPLHERFHLDEPWDSPHNRTLIEQMPEHYRLGTDVGLTRFRIFPGPGMPFETGHSARPQDFTDGVESTAFVFVVGADKAVPWTKPDEEPFDLAQPLKSLGLNASDPFGAVSLNSIFVRPSGAHPDKIAALATARGGEIVLLGQWFKDDKVSLEPPFAFPSASAGRIEKLTLEEEHRLAREKLSVIGRALRKQHEKNQVFGAPFGPENPRRYQLSWRVHLLPYLGYDELYQQVQLNEPWDSPLNLKLIERMPEEFRFQASNGRSRFVVVTGDQLLFSREKIASLSRVTDDPATTAAVFYVPPQRATIWTQPETIPFDRDQPRTYMGFTVDDPITLLFASGDVTTLPPKAHPAKLYALASVNGGELIDLATWFASAEIAEKPPEATVTPPTPIHHAIRLPAVPAPDPAKYSDWVEPDPDPIQKKLRLIGNAFHHRHGIYTEFLTMTGPNGGPLKLSWRVELLPFLDQRPLYNQFKHDEPWDSEHNRTLLSQMPDVFRSEPSDKQNTRFCLLLGNQTLFRVGKKAHISDVRDGSSNTILAAHVGSDKAVPWTKPDDLLFDADRPLECLGTLGDQFQAVMADGDTLSIPTSLPPEVFAALATANGREVVDAAALRRYAAHLAGKPLGGPSRVRALEQNKLKAVLMAMHHFHSMHRHFPPIRERKQLDHDGRPLLSWRVHLLKFLEHEPLAQQFRFEEPWDSPHNRQLIPLMPDVFRDSHAAVDSTTTRLMTFCGPNTPFPHRPIHQQGGTTLRDFPDGSSNTILVIQSAVDRAVPWTKPVDLEFDIAAPLACVGTIPADTGLLVGLADGSVRTLNPAVRAGQFKAVVTPNGKEVLDVSEFLK